MFRKIAMLTLVLFVLSVVSVLAQGQQQRQTPEERMAAQLKTLTEKLTLTADQQTKVKDLIAKNNEEMAKVRAEMQAGGDRQAMMDAMTKSRADLNKKIDALLDAKQKEAFAKYNKEQEELRAQRQRPPQQ